MTTHEEISKRAKEIWEREGRPEGRDKEHWLQAERELHDQSVRTQPGGSTLTSHEPVVHITAGPKEENGRKRTPRRGR